MFALTIIVTVLSAVMVIVTALSFIRTREWWVRIFDFPRAQIMFACLLLLLLHGLLWALRGTFAWWETGVAAAVGIAAATQFRLILPYTRCWKPRVPWCPGSVPRDQHLRLVVSNVLKDNRQFERWRQVVAGAAPDVIIAVEADTAWDRSLQPLAAGYPHAIRLPQANTYGLIVYSRLPLHHTKVKHLLDDDVPSLFTSVTLRSGRHVRLVVLHPRPPRPDIQQDSVLRDGELVRAGRVIRQFHRPVVVAGDLNDVAWSHTTRLFLRLARLLDPRVGRGRYSTFHADHRLMRYPLDHVFHSNHFDLVELRRLPHVGSDHFPILIELATRPHDDDRPEAVPMQEDDEDEAIDAVADARALRAEETPQERRERQLADR